MAIGMQDEYGQTPRKGLAALVGEKQQAVMAQPMQPGPAQQQGPALDPRDPGVVAAARELSAARMYLQKRGRQGP